MGISFSQFPEKIRWLTSIDIGINMFVVIVAFFAVTQLGCGIIKVPPITFVLPDNYEGAVVIALDQPDGVKIDTKGESITIDVPPDGVLDVALTREQLRGMPTFRYKSSAGFLTYVFRRNDIRPPNGIGFEELNSEESSSHVYVLNYDEGNTNLDSGKLRFLSFIVGKLKDGNLHESKDKNEKIRSIIERISSE